MYFLAQTITLPTQFKPLFDSLAGHNGWISTAFSWIGTTKIALHLFNTKIQNWLTANFIDDIQAPGSDHDKYVQAILNSNYYRVFAFVLSLFSFHLPTIDVYLVKLKEKFAPLAIVPPPEHQNN
jgi:hypothetical protein